MNDMRKDFATLLTSKDPLAIGVLHLLVDKTMLEKAAKIADTNGAIQAIDITKNTTCYSVIAGSSTRGEYIVVPRKYCTCHFYNDSVLVRRIAWTCKHDLAVQLRLALAGPETIMKHPSGEKLIREQLVYLVTFQEILYLTINMLSYSN